jgi:hypothetical protein
VDRNLIRQLADARDDYPSAGSGKQYSVVQKNQKPKLLVHTDDKASIAEALMYSIS